MKARIIVGGLVLLPVPLIGWTWLRGRRAKAELAAKYPPPGQMVDVGGYRLHVNCQGRQRGDGRPTVVIDAASGEFSLQWTLLQQQVAEFTRVCTYDRAGLGWSERSPKPYTAPNIVDDLHNLLTQVGVEPPYVLVGHSLGGLHARLFAQKHPDQVVGMVLVDPTHEDQFLRYPEAFGQLSEKRLKQMAWIMRLLLLSNSVGLLALSRGKIGKRLPFPLPEGTRGTYLGVICSDTRFFETMIEEMASIEETMGLLRAAQNTTLGDMPLMVLSACHVIPASQIRALQRYGLTAEDVARLQSVHDELHAELATLSPNGKQVMAQESGHHIYLDQPQLVIDAIRQVVEAARRERGTFNTV